MDLRNIMNSSDSAAAAAAAAAQAKQQQQQQQHQVKREPSTPVQSMPSHFRDFNQASPRRSASNDFPPQQQQQQQTPGGSGVVVAPYASPGPYPPSGPYPGGRPAGPPLDIRSPSVASAAAGASPYRQTPTGVGPSGVGYPFPNTGPPPVSPVQRHQPYPPSAYPPRDTYSQTVGATGQPGHPSPYMQQQQQQVMPQTPPVATASRDQNPYLQHQRSQSAQSTPTPTSAHSQHQYGPPHFAQGSPVVAHHPSLPAQQLQQSQPPQDHIRHHSQPATPLGPPLNTQRPPSIPGAYAQPSSPYQQRMPSGSFPPHPAAHPSPGPPPPPAIPRMPSNSSISYDPYSAAVEAHRRSMSRSERGRSVSVSPKTRVSSLPSSAGGGIPMPEPDPRQFQQQQHQQQQPTMPSVVAEPDRAVARAATPAKRKMDDRDLRSDELEQQREPRPAPFEGVSVNGSRGAGGGPTISSVSASPVAPPPPPQQQQQQPKKRPRRKEPPVWALTYEQGAPLRRANFVVRKGGHAQAPAAAVNGSGSKTEERELSRQASPAAAEARAAAGSQPPPAAAAAKASLAEWEECIAGKPPVEEFTSRVADFLYLTVVANPNLREIQSRGVQFEIEAKLGWLSSKSASGRFSLPVESECILTDGVDVMFKSSMSEQQHQAFNEYLNNQVQQTHPQNPENAALPKPRRSVKYRHSREKDRFFELPPHLQDRLPGCVRANIRFTPSVRVTYDQQTGDVTAKIVKAKVGDLHIHFPKYPLDCRLSVNLECDWEGDVEELEAVAEQSTRERRPDRNKDRLSYSQGCFQIDLTQVTHTTRGPNNTERLEKEHELEIEINPLVVLEHGGRAARGEEHAYVEVVKGLVDDIRVLARQAAPFPK